MKKHLFLIFSLISIIALFFSFTKKDSNGKAGYTGSPGEQTCAGGGCHSGGVSASKGVTISSTPTFSNSSYYPDSVYSISITVAASSFTRFGFGCEALTTTNLNSGNLQSPGAGVKSLNAANGRKNMTHTTPKIGTTGEVVFTFGWKAPVIGTGNTIFYVCGNAVNLNGNTLGDVPIPASLTLTEAVVPKDTSHVDTTSMIELVNNRLSQLLVYPIPARGLSHVSYFLKSNNAIKIQLNDINGRVIKTLLEEFQTSGNHSHILDLTQVSAGVYFIKVFSGNNLAGQKLMVVN